MTKFELIRKTFVYYACRNSSEDPVDVILEVESLDLKQAVESMPKSTVAFYYFDEVSTTVNYDGDPVELKSKALNRTKDYYIDAKVLTYEEAEKQGEIVADERDFSPEDVLLIPRNPASFILYQPDWHELLNTTDLTKETPPVKYIKQS